MTPAEQYWNIPIEQSNLTLIYFLTFSENAATIIASVLLLIASCLIMVKTLYRGRKLIFSGSVFYIASSLVLGGLGVSNG
jgi:hypothetical protein